MPYSTISQSWFSNDSKAARIVMLSTVVTVVLSHNLALGVGVGVLLSALAGRLAAPIPAK